MPNRRSYDRYDRDDRDDRNDLDDRGRRAPFRSAVGRSFGKWIGIAVAGSLFVTLGLPNLGRLFDLIGSPFATKTVDRSQPVLLHSIRDLSEYRAASANLQVIVDVEKDVRFFPAALRGERTLFLAHGAVDATVDFSKVGPDSIRVYGKTVYVSLPQARLARTQLDMSRSRVFSRKRGLLDRIGGAISSDAGGNEKLYTLAERKLRTAARRSDVLAQAQSNTAAMLRGLATPLGYTDVRVTFVAPPPAPKPGSTAEPGSTVNPGSTAKPDAARGASLQPPSR